MKILPHLGPVVRTPRHRKLLYDENDPLPILMTVFVISIMIFSIIAIIVFHHKLESMKCQGVRRLHIDFQSLLIEEGIARHARDPTFVKFKAYGPMTLPTKKS